MVKLMIILTRKADPMCVKIYNEQHQEYGFKTYVKEYPLDLIEVAGRAIGNDDHTLTDGRGS